MYATLNAALFFLNRRHMKFRQITLYRKVVDSEFILLYIYLSSVAVPP